MDNYFGDDHAIPNSKATLWLSKNSSPDMWLAMICWTYLDCLRESLGMKSQSFIEQVSHWRFLAILESALWDMGSRVNFPAEISRSITMLMHLEKWQVSNNRQSKGRIIRDLLSDEFVRDFFRINNYDGKTWFGKEGAEKLFFLLEMKGMIEILTKEHQPEKSKILRMEKLTGRIMAIKDASENSSYNLDRFLEILDQD
jgi:hypothetical protein